MRMGTIECKIARPSRRSSRATMAEKVNENMINAAKRKPGKKTKVR